jgi:hypothetical protein
MAKLQDVLNNIKYGENYAYVDLMEDLEDSIEELDEGVKHFKTSKRLNTLADKLVKKAKGNREVEALATQTRNAAKEFAKVEDRFAMGQVSKAQARISFDAIKKQYSEVMKKLKNRTFFSGVKTAGTLAIIGGIVATFLFGWQPFQAVGITVPSLDSVGKAIAELGTIVTQQFNSIKKLMGGTVTAPIDIKTTSV